MEIPCCNTRRDYLAYLTINRFFELGLTKGMTVYFGFNKKSLIHIHEKPVQDLKCKSLKVILSFYSDISFLEGPLPEVQQCPPVKAVISCGKLII